MIPKKKIGKMRFNNRKIKNTAHYMNVLIVKRRL